MTKIESIDLLESLGLNVPKVLYRFAQPITETIKGSGFSSVTDCLDTLRRHPSVQKVSIRTFRPGHFKCPFYPNINWEEAELRILECLEAGYDVYLFEGIDPGNCLKRGNISIVNDVLRLEWLDGSGTVRDLETSDRINHLSLFPGDMVPEEIEPFEDIITAYKSSPYITGRILEFSLYKSLVGTRKEHAIYWELREWK